MSNYDSDSILLLLPLPPSLNSYYKYTSPSAHNVIKYVSPNGKIFAQQVLDYIKTNNFDIKANIPLKVTTIISFPTNQIQDLDNRMKSLLDALTKAEVWEDDSLIHDLSILKGPIQKPGSCTVQISELDTKAHNALLSTLTPPTNYFPKDI